ncbi:Phosphatidylserine synthase 1 [Aphelenchoides besseyi]|nr:Phosphatidylserine synthase 1 [Aphelenchoides besseyi]KAI6210235.1 Phosphatidylserine synthase 1 [Aphelenchoides besseyi]
MPNEPGASISSGDYELTDEDDAESDDQTITDDERKLGRRKRERADGRRRTMTDIARTRFRSVNERIVHDITLEALYKPHTITVLVVLAGYLLYNAFYLDDSPTDENIYFGLKASVGLFLVLSAMAFPNGPFIRPHPLIWRVVFGMSVLYALILQFVLFQTHADIKQVLTWFDPAGLGNEKLSEKEYAVNCSDVSLARIWSYMDIFAVGHFLGWAMKALLIRHWIICWYISIAWELTEVFFAHLLPNFQECWWDAIFLDVILCNGLGITIGLLICRMLEMRTYHWESIRCIQNKTGKFKRAVLQFTPESWIKVDWFNSFALRRWIALFLFIMVWLISELNTFFLKHVFAVDTSHPVVFWRIIFIALISAPTIRQYYVYVTDPSIKRLGMQCWIYLAVCLLELAICVKFGRRQLPRMKIMFITVWVLVLVWFDAVSTFGCVWLSVKWAQYSSLTKTVPIGGGKVRDFYVDSAAENPPLQQEAQPEDQSARRRRH